MREIKFRAWDNHSKKMFHSFEEMNIFDEYLGYWFGNGAYELMQFTGLLDKNGKEIYEGDIIQFEDWNEYYQPHFMVKSKVCFNESHFGYFVIGEKNTHLSYIPKEKLEIIGNIHENPELLK